jgi:membrane protease YdiL (CAAX protease family)
MQPRKPLKPKIYARAITAILLIVTWALITLSGVLLYLAPSGFRSGRAVLFLGLSKSAWDDIHFWIGVITVVVIILHIIIDWKALRGVIRYLTSTHRGPLPTVEK